MCSTRFSIRKIVLVGLAVVVIGLFWRAKTIAGKVSCRGGNRHGIRPRKTRCVFRQSNLQCR